LTVTDKRQATHQDRCAAVERLWRAFEGRDWLDARGVLVDRCTMTWHTSGERFLDADAVIRVNAVYPEGWALRVVEINALDDGRVHSVIEVRHAPARFLANSLFHFDGALIDSIDEYWATAEVPPAWRDAAPLGAHERF
jgi:hypothetical protein